MRHVVVRHLAFTPRQLFDLVADVERYPHFVPWVTAMRTWNRRDIGDGVVTMDTEARVKFAVIRERFATRDVFDSQALVIDVTLLSGPFRHLSNRWRFTPHPDGAELNFEIDFEFGTRLLHGLLSANLERAVAKLISCFERRASDLYGLGDAAATPTII